MYSSQVGVMRIVLCVDVYCDGIALPKNGAISLSPLRVRFSNFRAIKTVRYDIGLCPVLYMGTAVFTSTKLTELRREILQRNLFLVLIPLIEASSVGFRHDSTIIFPRILMVLCDQKQERPLLCLKCSNSTRDCTDCDMLSKVTAAEAQSRIPASQSPPVKKRCVLITVPFRGFQQLPQVQQTRIGKRHRKQCTLLRVCVANETRRLLQKETFSTLSEIS